MNFKKRKLFLNLSVTSKSLYCPIVWMFHSRRLNNNFNSIYEWALRIIYQDYTSSFTELLSKDSSLTFHQRNSQKLVTEMFKVKIGIALGLKKDIFETNSRYNNLLYNFLVKRYNVRPVWCGTERASFLAPKLWGPILEDCKIVTTLSAFKEKTNSLVPENGICRICKTWIRSMLHSYRNLSIDLQCQSIDCFLYECNNGLAYYSGILLTLFWPRFYHYF